MTEQRYPRVVIRKHLGYWWLFFQTGETITRASYWVPTWEQARDLAFIIWTAETNPAFRRPR